MILEKYTIYRANKQTDNNQLIHDCLSQVDFSGSIVKINVFYRAENSEDFDRFISEFESILAVYIKQPHPVLNFIGQQPVENKLEIEVVSVMGTNLSIDYYNNAIASSALVVTADQSNLYIGCHADPLNPDLEIETDKVLGKLRDTIAGYDFSIHDIKRQWNYIEDITVSNENQQNYQVFNNKRSELFSATAWEKGYPAATGIGSKFGALLVDTVAIKSDIVEKPLSNPLQKNAHQYSKNVLVGDQAKRTPKFERAKILHDDQQGMLYVSGTAAIRGEDTISNKDVNEQTRVTIENIKALLAHSYVREFEQSTGTRPECNSARVYLKYAKDFGSVKDQCVEFFGDNILFVEADVCRDDLLIEIEATYTYTKPVL